MDIACVSGRDIAFPVQDIKETHCVIRDKGEIKCG